VLAWVQTTKVGGKRQYRVLPVAKYEQLPNYFTDEEKALFTEFANDSRSLFDTENYNVTEIGYRNGSWIIPWASPPQKFLRRIRRIEPWRKEMIYPVKIAI
jgi:hypothetical protein